MLAKSALETGIPTICRLRRMDENKGRLKNVECSINYIKLANICDEDSSALRPENGHRPISGNLYFKYTPDSG
jgi:hypothetical protein